MITILRFAKRFYRGQGRFLVLLLVLAANIPGPALATENAWLQLIGPSNMVAAWQGECSEWTMAAGVVMDEENR